MRITTDVLATLSAAEAIGNQLKLVGQLDRSLYERTNKVLEAAGGKWNRKVKAHVFDGDASDAIEQIILTGEITIPQDFGYFPTPSSVVDRLIELADVRDGHRVLEPSAGRGNIACAFRDTIVDCYELLPENVDALEALGYDHWSITQADFLSVEPSPIYDRVVMNPPFEKRADIHHVRHALQFLVPDGRLVSVMSAGVLFRTDRLTSEFRALVDERGGSIEELPEGAFKASGTMVNTVVAVIPA
ncbi:restriction endonuclease subunit M [Burkholderia anthina]|uniref:methyltransferase n=1 Tax=Burkholderia anthina TaxID=179879 RepID=UPI0007588971|nr:methyltransferase [Burkholderia anthina]KVH04139.1 restriction endonuclease subunit M [Burkholderia anthina]KVH09949.1 restriction endonuclease subunit M [Burkholderia anthina]KVM87681.1 restriction endonuclease subunit M [Burkholderia anthina]KVX38900.1 restriction endonuclease subunit M [Burkholderia anthina]